MGSNHQFRRGLSSPTPFSGTQPESPRWLIRMGRHEDARKSLAWALQVDPKDIELPAILAETEKTAWRELFKYPRSVAAACLTGLTQTGGAGLLLWQTTLFVLVLKVTPAVASYLVIWVSLAAILGRFCVMAIIERLGRRGSGVLCCLAAAVAISIAGQMPNVYIGAASMFFVMILVTLFFGSGNYAIVAPYMAEVWPTRLRTSGMGLGYGVGNFGKIIGPLGLALIAGSSDYISPKATLDALGPAFLYFGSWWILGAIAFWFIGFETKGRSFEEMDRALTEPAARLGRAPPPSVQVRLVSR
jgi:putative MFS transporter